MFSRVVGAIAAISVGSHAFLLPPGTNSVHSADGVGSIINPLTQTIKLPCPDCVFSGLTEKVAEADNGDDLFWVQGGARAIVLNFTLSDDMKVLNLNDRQIYPPILQSSPFAVAEVSASASMQDLHEHPEQATVLDVTSSSIAITSVDPSLKEELIQLKYQIGSLSNQPVSVDAAEVQLLEGADGSLMIMSVERVGGSHSLFDSFPFPPSSSPEGKTKECNMLPAALCKWKSAVESKIGEFRQGNPHKSGDKGCGGRKGPHRLPGHIRPSFEKFGGEERPEHHQGHPPHPHGMHGDHTHPRPHHHHQHGHHDDYLETFVMAFISVMVPVIAGITLGMLFSLVGMVAGRLITYLWIKYRRGGQRGYASVAQSEVDSEDTEKGVVDVVVEESLPVYEAAPAYEEKDEQKQQQQ